MELALKTTATTALRDEQALVNAARGGDDRAFEQLYARYRDRVTAFINSKVRDHGRAEDISQEVFMAALRQLRSHDQPIAFKPWIFAIAKNACIDEFRRSKRGREVPVETDDDFPTDQRASLSIVPSPPAAIESKQRLEDLRGAFGGLSESHHRLIVMRELEGRSYDEIGTRLGMTRQMVESGLFRARRKLSEEYDELASGRRCEQVQTVIDSGAALELKALGIKERRRLTQHLSHCQACRHEARLAGIDETLLKPRSIREKIAALVPFGGLWRWPRRRGGSAAARGHASGHVAASGAAQTAGTVGSSIGLGQAAAAIAALAVAGAGGGVAIAHIDHSHRAPAAAHHIRTAGTTGASAASAAQTQAGSATAAGQNRQTFSAKSSAIGSNTGPTALGTGTKRSGTNSPVRGQKLPVGGSGSATSPGASNPTSSSGNPAASLLNTAKNTPGQTLSKVTAPIKKLLDPIKSIVAPVSKATNPVTAPVKKILSSPPVKNVTSPVTAPVQKVLSSPPVKSVTAPVKSVTAPVKSVTAPVKSVAAPVVKSVTAPVKSVAAPVVKTVTAPVKSVVTAPVKTVTAPVNTVTAPVKSVVTAPVNTVTAPVKSVVTAPVKGVTAPVNQATNPVTSAPPVKNVGSTVTGTVQKVVPPTSTTPTGTGGSSSSSSPVTVPKTVLGGP